MTSRDSAARPSAQLEELLAASLLRLGTDTAAARTFKHLGGDAGHPVSLEDLGTAMDEPADRLARARAQAEGLLRTPGELPAGLLPVTDPRYPAWLRQIPDPPLVLWTRGDVTALSGTLVAVIGSRHPSTTGLLTARRLSKELTEAGLTVVSGLARGIDGAAHRAALEAGGRTVAVLGCGPDVTYPPEHRLLADDIQASGAIVTEFPPGTRPEARNFPLRNRIISGLSRAVVVVEASEKSGTLITARAALEQGRDVLAVPGNVLSGQYRGCHALIKDGARLVETVEDILQELGWAPSSRPAVVREDKSSSVSRLTKFLPLGEAVSAEELAVRTGRSAARCLEELAALEIAGAVSRVPGGGYVRVDGPATNIEARKDSGSRHAEGSRRRRIARKGEDD